jgi:hypothetical protein
MITVAKTNYTIEEVNAKFLKMLPLIKMIAHKAFRDYDYDRREDAVQSVVVDAFQGFKSLVRRGLMHRAFATPLARYAIKHYRAGRPGGMPQNSEDVLSERCQLLGRADVKGIVSYRTGSHIRVEILIYDDRTPDPAMDAQCNIDYENWRKTLKDRDREMLDDFLAGELTSDMAGKYNLTDGSISQTRRKLVKSYRKFVGDC